MTAQLRVCLLATAVFFTTLLPGHARALDIQSVTSPGGITGWLVEDHDNPILTMSFSFNGGEAAEPIGKEGLARLLSATLD